MIVTLKGWAAMAALAGATAAAVLGFGFTAAACGAVLGYLVGVRP